MPPDTPNHSGLHLGSGATASVANNHFRNTNEILIDPSAAGSVSANEIIGSFTGINSSADAVSITNNKFFDNNTAMLIGTSVAPVTGNTIQGNITGISLGCRAGGNVHSNTIQDALIGLDAVPEGAVVTNTFFNVTTLRNGC